MISRKHSINFEGRTFTTRIEIDIPKILIMIFLSIIVLEFLFNRISLNIPMFVWYAVAIFLISSSIYSLAIIVWFFLYGGE